MFSVIDIIYTYHEGYAVGVASIDYNFLARYCTCMYLVFDMYMQLNYSLNALLCYLFLISFI